MIHFKLILSFVLFFTLTTTISAQDKYHGGKGDGYASATASKTTALPAMLVSFDAIKDNNNVQLTWSTAGEINSEKFILERSTDGVNFETINEQFSQGNTISKTIYSYTDSLNDLSGMVYYRLLQKDINKYAQQIGVKKVMIYKTLAPASLKVFPNPANDLITLTVIIDGRESNYTVNIIGIDGKCYHSEEHSYKTTANLQIEISNLPEGVYIVYVLGANNQALKFVVKH